MVQISGASNIQRRTAESYGFVLRTHDGYSLSARLWSVPSDSEVAFVAVVNAGAGIVSEYYDRFAAYLAENGIPTLVYDYRGIGHSRPRSLRGFPASVEDWGSKDCSAALDWLLESFPRSKRIVIGHSIGAFVTGFVTNGSLVDQMHVLMPILTKVFGYFPGRRLHMLEDLPKGVALEWATRIHPEFWWRLKRDDGTLDTERVESLLKRFESIRAATIAVRFTDDPFATAKAAERILGLFSNAFATHLVLNPEDAGGQAIGHFGFFRSRFRTTLWPRVLQALTTLDLK